MHENEVDLTLGIAGEPFRQMYGWALEQGPKYVEALRIQYIRQLSAKYENFDVEQARKYFKGE